MTTLHINVEESLAEAVRKKVAAEGKTLEEWIAEVMAQRAGNSRGKTAVWAEKILASSKRIQGDSGGWKWNRAELYE